MAGIQLYRKQNQLLCESEGKRRRWRKVARSTLAGLEMQVRVKLNGRIMPNDKATKNRVREISLADALEEWSDRDVWNEFRQLEKRQRLIDSILDLREKGTADQEEIDILERELSLPRNARDALNSIVRSFSEKLEEGYLIAEGYALPRKPRSRRQKIPIQMWRRSKIDFERSAVRGDGLHFVDVIVRRSEVVGLNPSRKTVSMGELQRWYKGYVSDCVRRGVATNRDEDVIAGKERFGNGVSVRTIRDLRSRFAPEEWSRKGRRAKSHQPT